jgi:hypothetical protein
VRRGREDAHAGAGLGHDHFRGSFSDSGDGFDEVAEAAKRFDHHLDPGGQLRDVAAVLINGIQIHAGQKRVVIVEPAGQRLGQLRDPSTPRP